MYWVKAKWIDALFAAFNAVAPNRKKDSDGTIGDTAHQKETSGHNPDDTPGVSAERSDPDSIPEVRAADVTSTLNAAVTMEQIVQIILAACRSGVEKRFIYIIYNRRIWRKSNGWKQEVYTGSDPHENHAHFSGDPDYDEDGSPFTYITGSGTGAFTMLAPCKKGDKGFAVGVLQKVLLSYGFNPGAVDNDYGPNTTAALKQAITDPQRTGANLDPNFTGEVFDDWAFAALLTRVVSAGSKGKDGKDGVDGKDGKDGKDAVLAPGMKLVVAE